MKRRSSRRTSQDIAACLDWNQRVTALGCQVCRHVGDECDGVVQGHHVLYRQFIRDWLDAHAWENHLTAPQKAELEVKLIWDVRNGMGVCYRAHRRHHNRRQAIPLDLVPLSAIAFATELGLAHRLEALYPADDPARLTAA